MGLAATRTKQRFGLDPRNTAWSNDTSRFGHTMLEKFGWKPGMGLGMVPAESHKSHIKVTIKDDTVGLGAKIKRKERKDEFDNGECAGLDVFQRILGRLNGKEKAVTDELEKQRIDKVLNGKWGVHFIKGEVLASTWDPETKKLKSYSNEKSTVSEESASDSDGSEEVKEVIKKAKRTKGSKLEDKSKARCSKESKKQRKEQKKMVKKAKKKEKKKHREENKELSRRIAYLESSPTASNIPANVSTRLSIRAKHIRQKRAATMDSKALNEIFMVTDN
ncbi:hypothetical protein HG536_0A00350 [Torulaspora globosa]|uniref:Protein PXR1 n=1 Tax=Torulaspora globosa TaxID=48254 RepID=A0A7G3Z9N2_9SACH|nr:uncharacterized protein HG536_0A00350 [Torulaspora globosa]QLL30218.1 hypothetical protein HG536_0A00350 [Torulaspora globosa]